MGVAKCKRCGSMMDSWSTYLFYGIVRFICEPCIEAIKEEEKQERAS